MLTELKDRYDAKKLLDCIVGMEELGQQIHVSSINGKRYSFATGDLTHYKLDQNDFTVVNELFKGTYAEEVYNDLNEKYDICRGRYMTLDENFRGYSYHYDITDRIHIPLTTNEDAIFIVNDKIFKMPEIGNTYQLHTTNKHTAMNLGKTPRIHFTVCVKASAVMQQYYARMTQ